MSARDQSLPGSPSPSNYTCADKKKERESLGTRLVERLVRFVQGKVEVLVRFGTYVQGKVERDVPSTDVRFNFVTFGLPYYRLYDKLILQYAIARMRYAHTYVLGACSLTRSSSMVRVSMTT